MDDDEGYDSPTIIYMELEYMGRGQEPNLNNKVAKVMETVNEEVLPPLQG